MINDQVTWLIAHLIFMANDPFPAEDFDGWAETYDQAVLDQAVFPFAGYHSALEKVFILAAARPGMSILDLGVGTGNLALPFDEIGCELWCTDFSAAMLEKARLKLPAAHFIEFDLRAEWPSSLNLRFDRIVSAYVFHHFELAEKVRLIEKLVSNHLTPEGSILIADVSFLDWQAQEAVRLAEGDAWEDEYYWLADEALPVLRKNGLSAEFHPISFCSGVFEIR